MDYHLGVRVLKVENNKHILSYILGTLAAILCIATLVLLFEATELGTVYVKTSGNPEEVVCYFFECIENGDYDNAYTCLADFSDLGLAASETENLILNEALKKSYKCDILNDLEIDGLTAKTNVEFTYLDLALLQEKMENGIKPVLESYVEKFSREELYDENGDYKQELLQMVYDEVLLNILKKDKNIYQTVDYQVDLQYMDNTWKILTNKDMIKCFLGGRSA